jgi:hypothetical protein
MRRGLVFLVVVSVALVGLASLAAAEVSLPSGERINGGSGANGGVVIEPVYDDMTGAIRYVSTPRGVADPVNSNPRASAPFYLPVYPTKSTIGVVLNCQHIPTENCPDHGGIIAQIAEGFVPGVYGEGEGVLGHDHLMAGPGSHGDFNVAWVPIVLLFTNKTAANTHVTTLKQIEELREKHEIIEVPLDGKHFGLPNRTFHCSVVSGAVYEHATPFLG